MSTIEGGMITTNDKKFYNLCLLKDPMISKRASNKDQNLYKRKYKTEILNFCSFQMVFQFKIYRNKRISWCNYVK